MSSRNQRDGNNEIPVFDPTATLKLVNKLFANETRETMFEKDFYAMEFNISCRTRDNIYVPIEVGIVKFNIKDGVKDSYHDFIDPGTVPLGYAGTARDLYETYHGIPVHGFWHRNYNSFCEFSLGASRSDEEVDYHNSIKEAIRRIDEFVRPDVVYKEAERGRPGTDVRPVFSFSHMCYDGVAQTDGCLRRLASEAGNLSFYESFQVMDIVHMLKFACHLNPKNVEQPYAVYNNHFHKKLILPPAEKCCAYHNDIGSFNCAIGIAHCNAYCFLDFACPHYPVKPSPAHFPPPPPPREEW